MGGQTHSDKTVKINHLITQAHPEDQTIYYDTNDAIALMHIIYSAMSFVEQVSLTKAKRRWGE